MLENADCTLFYLWPSYNIFEDIWCIEISFPSRHILQPSSNNNNDNGKNVHEIHRFIKTAHLLLSELI